MRKNFGAKAICYPMPVFIIGTYNADGSPNAMNAAWGGISEEQEISICVDDRHKTAENLMARKAFTVSMATAECMTACDYVGIVSGNDVPDKFAKAGFHAVKSEFVDAPLIAELPMALECEVISYDTDTCRLVGRIVNVCADESVLGENGKVDVQKLRPITYDPMNHHYAELPMALECEVISYDTDTCRLVGRIVNVCADESVLGENGKVDVQKLRPITYDPMNHHYLVLGEKVGQAFHDGTALK